LFKHLPGFGFFIGPGRYTILGTLALSLLAGLVFDTFLRRSRWLQRWVFFAVVSMFTFADLRWSSVVVSDAVAVANPPYRFLEDSWLAKYLRLADAKAPVRLFATGGECSEIYSVSVVYRNILGSARRLSERTFFPILGPPLNDRGRIQS
jgi:hypothetical protein